MSQHGLSMNFTVGTPPRGITRPPSLFPSSSHLTSTHMIVILDQPQPQPCQLPPPTRYLPIPPLLPARAPSLVRQLAGQTTMADATTVSRVRAGVAVWTRQVPLWTSRPGARSGASVNCGIGAFVLFLLILACLIDVLIMSYVCGLRVGANQVCLLFSLLSHVRSSVAVLHVCSFAVLGIRCYGSQV